MVVINKSAKAGRVLMASVAVLMSSVMFTTAHAQQAAASTSAPAGSITDVTIFHVKPARADDFLDVMRKNVVHSRTEDGNLRFDAYSETKGKALTVYVLETWRDADAQKQHAKQPTLIALHKSFAQDLIGHPQSSVVSDVTR